MGGLVVLPLFYFYREKGFAMVQEQNRGLYSLEVDGVMGRREGGEAKKIIYCLINRLSLFLETKREVNRAVEEIRILLRRRVCQRQNARKESKR